MATLTELVQTVCQRLAGSCYCKNTGLTGGCTWSFSIKKYACGAWMETPFPQHLPDILTTATIEVMVETAREE